MSVRRRGALGRLAAVLAVMVLAVCVALGAATVARATGDDASQEATVTETPAETAASAAKTYEATTTEGVKVTVDAPEGALPEDARLSASLITDEGENNDVAAELDEAEVSYEGFMALDVSFINAAGEMIEPTAPVNVRFEVPADTLPEETENLAVHHLSENEDGTVAEVETVADEADATDGVVTVENNDTVATFSVDGFSTFVFTWGGEQDSQIAEAGTASDDASAYAENASADGPGDNILTETFEGNTLDGRWILKGNAGLTAAGQGSGAYQCKDTTGVSDWVGGDKGPGYLMLTSDAGSQSGSVLFNDELQTRYGLNISFFQWQFGTGYNHGDHADGICFFLVDGDYELTEAGPNGGGLGYSAITDDDSSREGVPGGVLGVGLDVFGTYSTTNQAGGSDAHYCDEHGKNDRLDEHKNSVTVRGAGVQDTSGKWSKGYKRLATSTVSQSYLVTEAPSQNNGENVSGQANGTLVNIYISPVDEKGDQYITVTLTKPNGERSTPINTKLTETLPDTVKFGFSASTGGSKDAHFIRGLKAETAEPVGSDILLTKTVTNEKPVYNVGDVVEYRFLVQNIGGTTLNNVTISDEHIKSITPQAATIEPGEQVEFTGTYTLAAEDIQAGAGATTGTFTNTATATGYPEGGGQPVTSTDSADITAVVPVEPLGEPQRSKKIGYNGNDSYTLELSVVGQSTEQSTPISGQPLDIVLVLDDSSSMNEKFGSMTVYDEINGEPQGSYAKKVVGGIGGWTQGNPGGPYYILRNGAYVELEEVTKTETKQQWWGDSIDLKVNDGWKIKDTDEVVDPDTETFYTQSTDTVNRTKALQQAVNQFIDTAAAENEGIADQSQKIRIGIATYGGKDPGSIEQGASCGLTTVEGDGVSTLKSAVDNLDHSSNVTNPGVGMSEAAEMLAGVDSSRNSKKIVIFFTDGAPTKAGSDSFAEEYANNAVATAKTMKDAGTTIYSIGVFAGANPNGDSKENKFMNAVSSNCPSAQKYDDLSSRIEGANYYRVASDAASLSEIFKDISGEIQQGSSYSAVSIVDELSQYVQADGVQTSGSADADGFKLATGITVTVKDANGNQQPNPAGTQTYFKEADPENAEYGTVKVVFPPDYKLGVNWTYSVSFQVRPTDAAYTFTGELVWGEEGTDLYTDASNTPEGGTPSTSAGKPGLHSNDRAYVHYTADGTVQDAEFAKPVIQVHPVQISGQLQITKTLNGMALDPNMFDFTVTPVDSATVTAKQAATKAGLELDERGNYTYSNQNGANDGVAAVARTAGTLTFTPSDAGNTYIYEYAEVPDQLDSGYAEGHQGINPSMFEYSDAKYRVEIAVSSEGGLQADMTVYQVAADGTKTQITPGADGVVTINFTNTYDNTLGLKINKNVIDNNGSVLEGSLSGASFAIYAETDEVDGYSDGDTLVDGLNSSADGSGATMGKDGFTTGKEGTVSFYGLEPGTYWVVEVKTPTGYTLAEPEKLEIARNGDGTFSVSYAGTQLSSESGYDAENHLITVTVSNKKVPDLPVSGSSGTLVLGTAGVAAIALAATYLARRRFGSNQ